MSVSKSSSPTQLKVGAMGIVPQRERVATPVATRSDSVAIDICDLVVQAFIRKGYTDQESQASALGVSRKNYQKAITTTPNYDAYNPIMKRLGKIPGDVLKEFASLLAERVGLAAGVDSERAQASMQVADAVLNLMRVAQR